MASRQRLCESERRVLQGGEVTVKPQRENKVGIFKKQQAVQCG